MSYDRYDAMIDALYEYECEECPECGEETLMVGQTESFYEYAGGPKISPDETPVRCDNCDFEEVR